MARRRFPRIPPSPVGFFFSVSDTRPEGPAERMMPPEPSGNMHARPRSHRVTRFLIHSDSMSSANVLKVACAWLEDD